MNVCFGVILLHTPQPSYISFISAHHSWDRVPWWVVQASTIVIDCLRWCVRKLSHKTGLTVRLCTEIWWLILLNPLADNCATPLIKKVFKEIAFKLDNKACRSVKGSLGVVKLKIMPTVNEHANAFLNLYFISTIYLEFGFT